MSDQILDDNSEENPKSKKLGFLYAAGSFMIISSFVVFMLTKWVLLSLIICLLGTIAVWMSPKSLMDKFMASIPLAGFIFVLYSYAQIPHFFG